MHIGNLKQCPHPQAPTIARKDWCVIPRVFEESPSVQIGRILDQIVQGMSKLVTEAHKRIGTQPWFAVCRVRNIETDNSRRGGHGKGFDVPRLASWQLKSAD